MNPIVYALKSKEIIPFMLFGEMVYYRDGRQPERIWHLNIYSSAKSRQIAEKKMKRGSLDVIFIEWDVTMERILKEGKMVFPIASDKVLLKDKIDICRQLIRKR